MKMGLTTPNFGQMGGEMPLGGNGRANPYGSFPGPVAAPAMPLLGGGHVDSATSNIGYRPTSGRADRLDANIVGGGFDSVSSGGFAKGATNRM